MLTHFYPFRNGIHILVFFILTFFETEFLFGNPCRFKEEISPEIDNSLFLILPDTSHQEGDTIAIYTSGGDSTFVTYSEALPDSMIEGWVINYPDTRMVVELSYHDAPVNEDIIGINLTDFFETGHANVNENSKYTAIQDPWKDLVDLAPKTIRVFSGSGGKFMHPLGYYVDDPLDDDYQVTYGGYGFNWKELIGFYDRTGPGDPPADLSDIVDDFNPDDDCDNCHLWMHADFVGDFQDFFLKWKNEPKSEPGDPLASDNDLYINQFIDLIDDIQTGGLIPYTVDVIYCVNILTESATEMLDIIDYLTDHGVNVVGVELGNEVYSDFQNIAMGFTDFDHYWKYINGDPYTDTGEEDALEAALPDYMEDDHNYISAIKDDTHYADIKIGLPAMNTPNCGADYDFPFGPDEEIGGNSIPVHTEGEGEDPCPCNYPTWNIDMLDKYASMSEEDYYKFDAIIFHPYYTLTNNTATCAENSNWRDIVLTLDEEFDPGDVEAELTTDGYYTGAWDYLDAYGVPTTPDSRLVEPFSNITGIHYPYYDDPLITGNFKEFTRDRIDISFEEHAYQMLFTDADDDPEDKEVWITEYNIEDKLKGMPGAYGEDNYSIVKHFTASMSNSFSHAQMLQNWFLWNLKANFDPDYRDNFLTVATIQSYLLPGSSFSLMSPGDDADEVLAGELTDCDDDFIDRYYIPRTTYYAVELWNAIHLNHLNYMKTNTTMSTANDNLAPTVFIDKSEDLIYVYYTNVTSGNQVYAFDPNTLENDFPGYDVNLNYGNITGHIINADQLYSNSGDNQLFDINHDYDDCEDATDEDIEDRFEINEIANINPEVSCPGPFTALVPYGVCVSVPPISMGYFIIPYELIEERLGNPNDIYSIYPNPASNYFIVQQIDDKKDAVDNMVIEINSIYGNLIASLNTGEGKMIDISQLPVGVYNVLIKTDGLTTESETLIKMK